MAVYAWPQRSLRYCIPAAMWYTTGWPFQTPDNPSLFWLVQKEAVSCRRDKGQGNVIAIPLKDIVP